MQMQIKTRSFFLTAKSDDVKCWQVCKETAGGRAHWHLCGDNLAVSRWETGIPSTQQCFLLFTTLEQDLPRACPQEVIYWDYAYYKCSAAVKKCRTLCL